MREAFKHLAKT